MMGFISTSVTTKIAAIIARAEAAPVDIVALKEQIQLSAVNVAHMAQMTRQTVVIPGVPDFLATYSIEDGHPLGRCRHMTLSVDLDRLPSLVELWEVAQEFGFVGSLRECIGWVEDLKGHGRAINIVQAIKS
jgi:hypothetical protein